MPEITENKNAREHLANERTLLAWVRTCIGIIALGFVVVKFSLFLNELAFLLQKDTVRPESHGYSFTIGISLIAVGAFALVLAFVKYKHTEEELIRQTYKPHSKLVLSLITIIFVICLFLIVYLMKRIAGY